MPYTLEEFCSDAGAALAEDTGPDGRKILARHLEKLLVDPGFVAEYLGPNTRCSDLLLATQSTLVLSAPVTIATNISSLKLTVDQNE